MRAHITLTSVHEAYKAINALWAEVIKPALVDKKRLVLTLRTETRSLAENAFLHALLTHISERQEWAGKRRDVETWKRLLIAAWCRARGEAIELLPALDGYGVDIVFRRSSELTVGECAELLEFVMAWMVEIGMQVPADPRQAQAPRRIGVTA